MLVSPVGDIGGGEDVLLALVRHLPALGYTADVVCLRPGPLEAAAQNLGAFAAAWQPHRMRDVRKVLAAKRWLGELIRERRPAVVHCNHMAHLYGRGPARRNGVKDVWHIHDYPHRWDWVDRLCRLVPTDHVVFTTPFVRSGYPVVARRYPHSVIPPAAAEPSGGPPAAAHAVRQRLGLPPVGPLFLTATRMQPHKGHAVLLAAARQVLRHDPAVTFVVTGSAADAAQEAYVAEVRKLARELGVDHAVRLVGRIDEADLRALYDQSTALVHPALTEGFGLALVNAMRAGLPVIAADAEGPRFVLAEGDLGVLVPRGDPDALAVAMVAALRQPVDRGRTARVAAIAQERFSPAKMAADVARVYDRLLQTDRT